MHSVVALSLALTVTLVFFAILYFTPYFSTKKIKEGKFDLLQFINLFFSPIFLIPIFYFLREIISRNPEVPILLFPKYVKELSFLGLLYMLILGHGMHSVSVVLSKNMKDLTDTKVWKVNEFFHNKFSHFLITFSAVFLLFSYTVMEINHPDLGLLTSREIAIIVISGMIAGIILGLASVEGSIPNIMFYVLYTFTISITFIFIKFNLDFRNYPFTTFAETMLVFAVVTLFLYKIKRKGFPEIVPQYFFD